MQKNMHWPEEIIEEISPLIIDQILSDEEAMMEDLSKAMSFGGKK